jgi:hypothetical protein
MVQPQTVEIATGDLEDKKDFNKADFETIWMIKCHLEVQFFVRMLT